MSRDRIETLTSTAATELSANQDTVTGSDIGTKRALDITYVATGFLDLISPTVSATACVSGDFVTEFSIPNMFTQNDGSGILQQITFINTGDTDAPELLLWIFNEDPDIGAANDATGDPLVITDAGLQKLIYRVPIFGGSIINGGSSNQAGQIGQLNVLVRANDDSKNLYCVVSCLSSFTPVADSYDFRFGVLPL